MVFNAITEAIQLFLLGMGTVFSLLLFLIFCISILSIVCKKISSPKIEPITDKNKVQNFPTNHEIAAAIIAVKKYKESH